MPLQRQVSPTLAAIPAIPVQAELLVATAALSSPPHIAVFVNRLKGKVTGPRQGSEDIHRRSTDELKEPAFCSFSVEIKNELFWAAVDP